MVSPAPQILDSKNSFRVDLFKIIFRICFITRYHYPHLSNIKKSSVKLWPLCTELLSQLLDDSVPGNFTFPWFPMLLFGVSYRSPSSQAGESLTGFNTDPNHFHRLPLHYSVWLFLQCGNGAAVAWVVVQRRTQPRWIHLPLACILIRNIALQYL